MELRSLTALGKAAVLFPWADDILWQQTSVCLQTQTHTQIYDAPLVTPESSAAFGNVKECFQETHGTDKHYLVYSNDYYTSLALHQRSACTLEVWLTLIPDLKGQICTLCVSSSQLLCAWDLSRCFHHKEYTTENTLQGLSPNMYVACIVCCCLRSPWDCPLVCSVNLCAAWSNNAGWNLCSTAEQHIMGWGFAPNTCVRCFIRALDTWCIVNHVVYSEQYTKLSLKDTIQHSALGLSAHVWGAQSHIHI